MQITLSTRQPNYQEVNLNKDKYRPQGDNANRRWRRDNRPDWGTRRTAVVMEEPEFTDVIQNVTVPAGRSVRLACSVKNLGSYKVGRAAPS
ncbi:unnamed protein product, partial [Iphiclides podalirius]